MAREPDPVHTRSTFNDGTRWWSRANNELKTGVEGEGRYRRVLGHEASRSSCSYYPKVPVWATSMTSPNKFAFGRVSHECLWAAGCLSAQDHSGSIQRGYITGLPTALTRPPESVFLSPPAHRKQFPLPSKIVIEALYTTMSSVICSSPERARVSASDYHHESSLRDYRNHRKNSRPYLKE
ncbi:hypothetical protein PM082_000701 [Marasmius tenuissimus]|nr:hypothetical protein PM082_000701 [Marasmius tenuissimus]